MVDLSGDWLPTSSPDPLALDGRAGDPSLWLVLVKRLLYMQKLHWSCRGGPADTDRLAAGLRLRMLNWRKGRGLRNLMILQMGGLREKSTLAMTNKFVNRKWIFSEWLLSHELVEWAKLKRAKSQQGPLIGSLRKSTGSGRSGND